MSSWVAVGDSPARAATPSPAQVATSVASMALISSLRVAAVPTGPVCSTRAAVTSRTGRATSSAAVSPPTRCTSCRASACGRDPIIGVSSDTSIRLMR